MYTLYPLGSIDDDPGALWLSYEWGESFENHEWRSCVEHFLAEVAKLGHEVVPLPSPPFTPCEDFVEVAYLVGGVRTMFTSDHLLSLITIQSEDPSALRSTWETIGNKVGWVNEKAESKSGAASGGYMAFLLACFALVGLMMYYLYYPFPGGRRPDILGFVVFWFRELVVLAIGFAIVVYAGWDSLFKQGKSPESSKPSVHVEP